MEYEVETITHPDNPSYVTTSIPSTREKDFESDVESFWSRSAGKLGEPKELPVPPLQPLKQITTASWH